MGCAYAGKSFKKQDIELFLISEKNKANTTSVAIVKKCNLNLK